MQIRAFVAVGVAAALLAGCVPLPLSFYVGDESAGRLSFGSCSLGVMPEGLEVSRAGILLLVSVRQWGDDEVVRIRFDVGNGLRARLASRAVIVDLRDGTPTRNWCRLNWASVDPRAVGGSPWSGP